MGEKVNMRKKKSRKYGIPPFPAGQNRQKFRSFYRKKSNMHAGRVKKVRKKVIKFILALGPAVLMLYKKIIKPLYIYKVYI